MLSMDAQNPRIMARKIALYITTPKLSQQQQGQIQHEFDTSTDDPSSLEPGYIDPVPSQEWAIGLSPEDIFSRHKLQHPEGYSLYAINPIVIFDDRTVDDGSVLVVSTRYNDETDAWECGTLRFEAGRVPLTAANLEISNQALNEVCRVSPRLIVLRHCNSHNIHLHR